MSERKESWFTGDFRTLEILLCSTDISRCILFFFLAFRLVQGYC